MCHPHSPYSHNCHFSCTVVAEKRMREPEVVDIVTYNSLNCKVRSLGPMKSKPCMQHRVNPTIAMNTNVAYAASNMPTFSNLPINQWQ